MSSFIHPSNLQRFPFDHFDASWRTAEGDGDRKLYLAALAMIVVGSKQERSAKQKGDLCFPLEVGLDPDDRYKWPYSLCSGVRYGSFLESGKSLSWDRFFLIYTFK
ncbi:UNVERIFIED_CONTAM: hypothetical protein Sangu_2825800 [Sesamum angustifolium]|uniref:Uncharacterized protein n=1 Tax=Sesamum angustifolium TaxID=2727405 RepID=A0AAW2IS51_9LAMI